MNHELLQWGIITVLFLAIAVLAIGLIFSPVVLHTQAEGGIVKAADNAFTIQGLGARGEAWKEYPTYNIGLGIIGVLAFIGATCACRMMYALKDVHNEAL